LGPPDDSSLSYDFLEEESGMHRVAVVDDNSDNRLIIRTILEDQYEILEFSSGVDALQGFKSNLPDLVILDISLPEMDGTEILRRLRSDKSLQHLPVIALTAHAMVGDREKYLSAGFNDYVAKPILDMNVLFSAIGRWLPQRTQATESAPGK
jgi:CheY-like chemotaxis protein